MQAPSGKSPIYHKRLKRQIALARIIDRGAGCDSAVLCYTRPTGEALMYQLTKYFVPIFAVVGAIVGLSLSGTGPGLVIGTLIGGLIGGVAGLIIRRL